MSLRNHRINRLFILILLSPVYHISSKKIVTALQQDDGEGLQEEKTDTARKPHVLVRRGASSLYPCRTLTPQEKDISFDDFCYDPGDFPIQNECRLFLHCIKRGAKAVIGCCPDDFRFDHRVRRCISLRHAICRDEDLINAAVSMEDYEGNDDVEADYDDDDDDDHDDAVDDHVDINDSAMDYVHQPLALDTHMDNKWEYYPAPKNLHPGVFWSRNVHTGQMWPAQFAYAFPISVKYTTIPLKRPEEGLNGSIPVGGNSNGILGGNSNETSGGSLITTLPPDVTEPNVDR